MKKTLSILFATLLAISLFAGCAPSAENTEPTEAPAAPATDAPATEAPAVEVPLTVIKVGASITPHSEILAVVKEDLAAQGYDLQVIEFTDYVQPNLALEGGELDANYFQHQPYLDDFNLNNNTHVVSVAAIHYEPFGIYPGKTKALSDIPEGGQIAVPNDGTNEARALLLLEAQGLIKLKEGAGLGATVLDIVENSKNLDIIEVEAAQLARSLQDVDFAVINGNYAIQAGLKVGTDAVATEDKDSVAADTYANVLCVKEGHENDPGILALIAALQSDKVKSFIETTYEGAVVPKF